MRKFILILGVLMVCGAVGFSAPTNDGMYATLQTSMGDICFELYYTNTPRTVANFVSLTEGTRTWIDPHDGFVSDDPFYEDLIFHRVITNFMIQGGCPLGTGTSGPGYRFEDEFDSTLRHTHAGVVSMANSGPNSNGSQFFITLKDTSWLDDKHSVFGDVVEGMDVVVDIEAVEVDAEDRPLVNVVITNSFITRNGSLANSFDPDAVVPSLPVVRPATNYIYKTGDLWILDWEEHLGGEYWLFATDDLISAEWGTLVNYSVKWPDANITGLLENNPRAFFNVTEVLYSE